MQRHKPVDEGPLFEVETTSEGYKRVKLSDMNALEQVTEAHITFGKPDSVAIVSGGLDSTTLVYHMLTQGYTPHLLSFNYGQRHRKELQYAGITAANLGLNHDIVDLTGITHLISNSALTSVKPGTNYVMADGSTKTAEELGAIEVPDGHYAEETMKLTVVPNRNMIMLSIAAGVAVNNKYRKIATGVHSGDHFVYPDCRPVFINRMNWAIWDGNQGFESFEVNTQSEGPEVIYAPFMDWTKADIAYQALELGVPLHLTWSCYKGGDIHCGKCGTCVERLEAIHEAAERFVLNQFPQGGNIAAPPLTAFDQTEYIDTEYWKTAVRNTK